MKNCFIKVFILFFLFFSAVSGFSQENGFKLRYNLPSGSKFTLKYSSNDIRIFKMGDRQAKSEVNTDFELFFNTVSGDLKTGNNLEGVIKKFDVQSRGPIESPAPDFSSLIDNKIGFILTSLGKVNGYSGFESLPEIDLGPDGKLNEERYKSNFKYLFPVFPEKEVKFGESWEDEFTETVTDEQGGKTTVITDVIYTLSEKTFRDNTECLKIDAKFNLKVNGKGKSQGTNFTITSEGNGSGIIYFDIDKGFILYMETTLGTKGEMLVSRNTLPLFSETTTNVSFNFD